MASERITMYRTNAAKTEIIEQLPKTVASQVYDASNEQFLDATVTEFTQHKDDFSAHNYYVTVSGNTILIASHPMSNFKLVEGLTVRFKNIESNSFARVTLNINSLGAKVVFKEDGVPLPVGYLKVNTIYTVCYDGRSFILQGKGGEYGTADATQVLQGYTVGREDGVVNGTLKPGIKSQKGTVTTGGYMNFTNKEGGIESDISLTVNALPFKPRLIYCYTSDGKSSITCNTDNLPNAIEYSFNRVFDGVNNNYSYVYKLTGNEISASGFVLPAPKAGLYIYEAYE